MSYFKFLLFLGPQKNFSIAAQSKILTVICTVQYSTSSHPTAQYSVYSSVYIYYLYTTTKLDGLSCSFTLFWRTSTLLLLCTHNIFILDKIKVFITIHTGQANFCMYCMCDQFLNKLKNGGVC